MISYSRSLRNLLGLSTFDDHLIRSISYLKKSLSKTYEIRVADLGCGNGLTLLAAKKYPYLIRGFLVDKYTVPNIQNVYDFEFEQCDICEFLEKLDNIEFDLILLKDVLEHFELKDAQRILALCKQSLAIGGVLLIQVPNGSGPFGYRNQSNDVTHKYTWGFKALQDTVESCGLESLYTEPSYDILPGKFGLIRNIISYLIALGINYIFLKPFTGWGEKFFWAANIVQVSRLSKR